MQSVKVAIETISTLLKIINLFWQLFNIDTIKHLEIYIKF